MYRLTPTQIQKIITQYNLAKAILDEVEEELEKATAKVRCLYKQRCLWAKKIARIMCCSIKIINELDQVEVEEAKAKRVWIAKQSTEVICYSSTEEASRMVLQELQLCVGGNVGVFDQSSIVNEGINQLVKVFS